MMKPKDRYAEAHEQLREKLFKLENMLPHCEISKRQLNQNANLNGDAHQRQTDKDRHSAGSGRRNFDVNERLNLLDKFTQRLSSKMEDLEKTRQVFTQEAQNLTDVLDQENQPVNGQSPTKCCAFDKHHDCLPGKCSCSENEDESSFSDSDVMCRCQGNCGKNCKRVGSCSCEESNNESESSDFTSDEKSCDSEKSACTCYCSKNESHVDTLDSDVEEVSDIQLPKGTRSERFRGGLDIIKNKVSNILKGEKLPDNEVFPENGVVEEVKPLKVNDLRQGLERLKIRNKNLKDFLESLQNPVPLVHKPSSIELPRKTRSCLMAVTKSRTKDSVILALSSELRSGISRKTRTAGTEIAPLKSKIWKSSEQQHRKDGKKFPKQGSVIGLLVILIILASQVVKSEIMSYLRIIKTVFIGSSLPMKPIVNDKEKLTEDFVSFNQRYIFGPAGKFQENYVTAWSEIFNLLGGLFRWCSTKFFDFFVFTVSSFLEYEFLIFLVTVALFAALALVKLRKVLLSCYKVYEFNEYLSVFRSVQFAKLRNRLMSSRLFWYAVGFYCHALLSSVEGAEWINSCFGYSREFMRWMHLQEEYMLERAEREAAEEENVRVSTLVNSETQLAEVREYDLFEQFDYSWIIQLLTDKFQDLVQLSYNLFINMIS